jgi:predicted alpha/beta-fold hydrolase
MPLIPKSTYQAPPLFGNRDIQTIFPSLFRKVKGIHYRRERIITPDGDFLDLDWSETGASRLVIISHGLEGDSQRSYVLGMVRAFNRRGWDAVAWNMRGCSGEPNKMLRFYHSGATEDLEAVVAHVRQISPRYRHLGLIGFSLGGNVTLKYLGEQGEGVDPLIVGAAAFSVPCDLASGAREMAKWRNRIYLWRFLRLLRGKIRAKMKLMPGRITDQGYHRIKTFKDFDDRYTAPLHGFESAEDYWCRASSRQFLPALSVPALLVNAGNDPFLGKECYPIAEARRHPKVYLEIPATGGHVGFVSFTRGGEYWSEARAGEFLAEATAARG